LAITEISNIKEACCHAAISQNMAAIVMRQLHPSHDNHEKINSWVSFSFLYENGALLGGPLGYQNSTLNNSLKLVQKICLHNYLSEKQTVFKE